MKYLIVIPMTINILFMKRLLFIVIVAFLSCNQKEKESDSFFIITEENDELIEYSKGSKDVWSEVSRTKLDKEKHSLKNGYVYKAKYLLTKTDIYDLRHRKFIYKGEYNEPIVSKDSNGVYFKRINFMMDSPEWDPTLKSETDSTNNYFYFDLNKQQVYPITEGARYRVNGVLSPNKKLGLFPFIDFSIERSDKTINQEDQASYYTGSIFLCQLNEKPKKILDSIIISQHKLSSLPHKIPIFWLNNEEFITQRNNGQLILGNINGETTDFTKNDMNLDASIFSPILYPLKNGEIQYECPMGDSSNVYIVDVDQLKIVPIDKEVVKQPIPIGGSYFLKSNKENQLFYKNTSLGISVSSFSYFNDNLAVVSFLENEEREKFRFHLFDKEGKEILKKDYDQKIFVLENY